MQQVTATAEGWERQSGPPMPPDDAVLIQAAQRDPTAFGDLYRRYLNSIYRYLYSRLVNVGDAEDVTAQVFLEALRGLSRYHHRGHFAAWLFTIARRRAADYHRHQPMLLPLDERLTPSDDEDPLSQAVRSETVAQLRKLVAGLDDGDAELLRLRYAAGLTFPQIAATLRLREGAVKMRLHRLLARLQAGLGGER